jgi:hypothetical protein
MWDIAYDTQMTMEAQGQSVTAMFVTFYCVL